MSATKDCPYCGETIQAVAVKCKHCGEYLDEKVRAGRAPKEGFVHEGCRSFMGILVVIGLLFVGFLVYLILTQK